MARKQPNGDGVQAKKPSGKPDAPHPKGLMFVPSPEQRAAIREARGAMRQDVLAKRAGVTAATISNLETKTGNVRRSVYVRVLRALKIKDDATDDPIVRFVDRLNQLDDAEQQAAMAYVEKWLEVRALQAKKPVKPR